MKNIKYKEDNDSDGEDILKNLSIGKVYYEHSKGIRELTKRTKGKRFYQCFDEGIESYINGDWNNALISLNKAKYLCPDDGPTNTILNFMSKTDYIVPDDWKKCRALTSKS